MTVSESQRAGIFVLAVICLSAYGLSLFTVGKPRTEKTIPFGLQSPQTIAVEFHGVQEEGIYFFPRGPGLQRIFDHDKTGEVLLSEGCLSGDACQGVRFSVSRKGRLKRETMSAAARLALDLPLDVNRSEADDLTLVPGIGESTAAAIVLLRKERGGFSSLEELRAVPGIKEKKLAKIKPYLFVGSDR